MNTTPTWIGYRNDIIRYHHITDIIMQYRYSKILPDQKFSVYVEILLALSAPIQPRVSTRSIK